MTLLWRNGDVIFQLNYTKLISLWFFTILSNSFSIPWITLEFKAAGIFPLPPGPGTPKKAPGQIKGWSLDIQFDGKNSWHLYYCQYTKRICMENPQDCLFEANVKQGIKWPPVNSFAARHLCYFQEGGLHLVAHIGDNTRSYRPYWCHIMPGHIAHIDDNTGRVILYILMIIPEYIAHIDDNTGSLARPGGSSSKLIRSIGLIRLGGSGACSPRNF